MFKTFSSARREFVVLFWLLAEWAVEFKSRFDDSDSQLKLFINSSVKFTHFSMCRPQRAAHAFAFQLLTWYDMLCTQLVIIGKCGSMTWTERECREIAGVWKDHYLFPRVHYMLFTFHSPLCCAVCAIHTHERDYYSIFDVTFPP